MMYREVIPPGNVNTEYYTYKVPVCMFCQGGANLCQPVAGDTNVNGNCLLPVGREGTNRFWVVSSTNTCPIPPLATLYAEANVRPDGDGDGLPCDPSECMPKPKVVPLPDGTGTGG
jgi:hypothetical protein